MNAGEAVERFDYAPWVHFGLSHGDALLGQVGFDEKEMARAPDLKIELIGVCACGGPHNFTFDFKLFQNVVRLRKVALHVSAGNSNIALVVRFFAAGPEFGKGPCRMVQEQAAESKQPYEEEQKQSSVEMQFAIPTLESGPEPRDVRRSKAIVEICKRL